MGETSQNSVNATFYQTQWNVQNVYNINGDLILSKDSTQPDFTKALEDLKTQVARLEGLEPDRKKDIESDIAAAQREASREEPSKGVIVSKLTSVQANLEATSGMAESALKLAKVVAKIAGWAAAFFI